MRFRSFSAAVSAGLLAMALDAHAHDAHVHGVARVDAAVEGNDVTIALTSPLHNLLGFEHAPRTAAERASARDVLAQLRNGSTLFVLSPSARCTLASVSVDAGTLDAASAPASSPSAPGAPDGHANLHADYAFRCDAAAQLRDIDVRLFAAFPRLQRVEVQLVTPRRQSRAVLTPGQPRVSW